jgi:chromosome segregation ATPase
VKKTVIALIPVALIAAVWVSPVTGQDAPGDTPEPVVRQLAGIQESLGDLVAVLSTMRRNQDAELILRRIEMHERRLAPLEGRLERNRREQLDAKTSIGNIEEWKSQTEERIHEIEREGREEVPLQLHQEVRMAEQQMSQEQERFERLQQQQIELENTLADRRDEVEILEDLLRELIE